MTDTRWHSVKSPPPPGTPCRLKVRHADGSVVEHKGPYEFRTGEFPAQAGGWYRAKGPGAGRVVLGKIVQWRRA